MDSRYNKMYDEKQRKIHDDLFRPIIKSSIHAEPSLSKNGLIDFERLIEGSLYYANYMLTFNTLLALTPAYEKINSALSNLLPCRNQGYPSEAVKELQMLKKDLEKLIFDAMDNQTILEKVIEEFKKEVS